MKLRSLFRDRSDAIRRAQSGNAVAVEVRQRPAEAQAAKGLDPSLPQFRSAGSGLLGRGGATTDENVRLRLRAAFTPSQPISDGAKLAGRRDVLASIIRAVEDQQAHVVLFGERGIGKTSLLHIIAELSRRARYVVRYVSCSEEAKFSDIVRAVLEEIPLLYHADFDPTSEQVESGESLASLLPADPVTVSQVSDLLFRVDGTQILVILDEFDRSASVIFRRQIAELMKSLSDRSVRVQFVIAGVAANLSELIGYIPSIRRNVIGVPVQPMNREEVTELIRIGETMSGLPFEPRAVERVIEIARGLPFLASLLGHHASLAASERAAPAVQDEDVILALQRAAEDVHVQITPQSRFFIDQVERDGGAPVLFELARAAVDQGGRIELNGPARAMLAELGQREGAAPLHFLLEAIPGDASGAERFVEEGAVLFLWMRYALGRATSVEQSGAAG